MVALTVYYLNLVFNHLLISYHCILQFAWSLNRGCFDNAIEPLLFHIVIGPWIFLHGIVKSKCGFFDHYFMWDPSTNYILIMWLDHYYPYLVIQPVILLHGTLAIIFTWVYCHYCFILIWKHRCYPYIVYIFINPAICGWDYCNFDFFYCSSHKLRCFHRSLAIINVISGIIASTLIFLS